MQNDELYRLQRAITERTMFEAFRRDPMLWVEERLKENPADFLWSSQYKGINHKWDGDKDPLAQAWMAISKSYISTQETGVATYKNVALESATGTGKTYMLARIVFWFLDCFENSLVVTTAPTEAQLKLGLWSELSMLFPKIKTLRPQAQKWLMRLTLETQTHEYMTEIEKINAIQNAWHAVAFIAGTTADETSANKARGFHRKHMLIILEECTGIPYPILTAFQNTCTGNTNYILAVGNPDNEFDTLHQFAQQKDCRSFRVSALDHPNIVLQKEIYEGAVTQSSINSRTDVYGKGTALWDAMVRGISPQQASDSLIRRDWVEQCVGNHENLDLTTSYNAVGVDVANSESGDKAAIAWGNGNRLNEVQEFQCPNATHLAYNLLYDDGYLLSQQYESYGTSTIYEKQVETYCIGIDAVGVGVATVNAFIDHRHDDIIALQGAAWEEAIPIDETTGRAKYRFQNLRAQMYWELREDLRAGNIVIDVSPDMENQLIKELCIAKFSTANGSISIEKKESIKKRLGGKSPNIADAVVYWNWVRKGYRISNFRTAAIG